MTVAEKIRMENVNHPGRMVRVDADKYNAVCDAIFSVLPSNAPGLTLADSKRPYDR